MAEITLTEEELVRLAKIAETIKEKGVHEAEKMIEQFKKEFEAPAAMRLRLPCDACAFCSACGPTKILIVGTVLVAKIWD